MLVANRIRSSLIMKMLALWSKLLCWWAEMMLHPGCHERPELVWSLCFISFMSFSWFFNFISIAAKNEPTKSNLQEQRFILAYNSRSYSLPLREKYTDRSWKKAHLLICISHLPIVTQSTAQGQGIVLPTVGISINIMKTVPPRDTHRLKLIQTIPYWDFLPRWL